MLSKGGFGETGDFQRDTQQTLGVAMQQTSYEEQEAPGMIHSGGANPLEENKE